MLTGDPSAAAGFSLGVASGSGGTVSISGRASGLGVYGTVADGVSGAGSISVTDGGHLVADLGTLNNGLLLGVNSGGAGTMSVESGAQTYVVGHSLIADAGAGSLSITGGRLGAGESWCHERGVPSRQWIVGVGFHRLRAAGCRPGH